MPNDLATTHPATPPDWRIHGIRVVRRDGTSGDTPVTMGMNREVALSGGRTDGALWAGTNLIKPRSATGAHHHGALHSIIYVIHGEAHMRWGDRLEWIAKAGAGDFLQVPAWLPHQEINASDTQDLHCVIVRSGPEELVVNLELDAAAEPEWVSWD